MGGLICNVNDWFLLVRYTYMIRLPTQLAVIRTHTSIALPCLLSFRSASYIESCTTFALRLKVFFLADKSSPEGTICPRTRNTRREILISSPGSSFDHANREIAGGWAVGVWVHKDSWLEDQMGSVLKLITNAQRLPSLSQLLRLAWAAFDLNCYSFLCSLE